MPVIGGFLLLCVCSWSGLPAARAQMLAQSYTAPPRVSMRLEEVSNQLAELRAQLSGVSTQFGEASPQPAEVSPPPAVEPPPQPAEVAAPPAEVSASRAEASAQTAEVNTPSGEVSTPLTAWLDLRPAAAGAPPQTVPDWVENFEFVAAKPAAQGLLESSAGDDEKDTESRARSVFRIRLGHPANAKDDLQVRVFFADRAGEPRPRVTAWNELGSELIRPRHLGQGLGLESSETLLVPMTGVNYLEIEAAGDGTQVRTVFLTWLDRTEVRQPADFPVAGTMREPFQILSSAKRRSQGDSTLYGVVTASLQKSPLVLTRAEAPSTNFQFPLDRAPMVAVVTYQVLGADVAAPPQVRVNGHDPQPGTLYLPDLADPGYQGNARETDTTLSFRYTGWLRAQMVIPGEWLTAGLNNLTLELSNPSDAVAIRSVEVQLKYNWDKFDYVLTPAATPAPEAPQ